MMFNEYTYNIDLLAGEIAKIFVHVEYIEEGMNEVLARIGETCAAQRAYIFEISEDGKSMHNIYEWCESGVEPQIDMLQNLSTSIFPWWIKKLKSGKILDIRNVGELEDEAKEEKKILEEQGIISALVFPIFLKGDLKGFVGFDNTKNVSPWKEKDFEVLELVSDLLSSAYAREISEAEIRESNRKLKKTIEDLINARNQLYRQEHMASIGRLSAGIAHEINNPLSFVVSNQEILKGYVNQLLDCLNGIEDSIKESISEMENDEASMSEIIRWIKGIDLNFIRKEICEINEDLESGTDRVKKIVDNLLFFSDMDFRKEETSYDVKEGIESVLMLVEHRLKGKIAVSCLIDSELPKLRCCKGEVNQVLLSIINNSIDALEKSNGKRDKWINIRAEGKGGYVLFAIHDNGIGMTNEEKRNVFNPFYSTKRNEGAMGLEMSMVYEIVEKRNKGKIEFESEKDVGTKFKIYIPVKCKNI